MPTKDTTVVTDDTTSAIVPRIQGQPRDLTVKHTVIKERTKPRTGITQRRIEMTAMNLTTNDTSYDMNSLRSSP